MIPKNNIRIKTSYVRLVIINPLKPRVATTAAEIEKDVHCHSDVYRLFFSRFHQFSVTKITQHLNNDGNFQFKDDLKKTR